MNKKKLIMVFGTRPEAIKMCPLALSIKKSPYFETKICLTGQHQDMVEQVMRDFSLSADFDLQIMREKQDLFDVTTRVLTGLKNILAKEKPWLVLVHGDTSTTFAAALACFYSGVNVGHVEAGLRTWNIHEPFPEEFNREAVSIISKYNFCPTKKAFENLAKEGRASPLNCIITGNTGIDALRYTVKAEKKEAYQKWIAGNKLILLTAHRRENWLCLDDMFAHIRNFVDTHEGYKLIYPAHPNPIVQKAAHAAFDNDPKIKVIPPMDVIDFHSLIAISHIVLTDSGGIQEEAPYFGIPVLVMRNVTERPEGVEAGTLKLVGNDGQAIEDAMEEVLLQPEIYEKMSKSVNPFGDGHASERIVSFLENRSNEDQ